MAAVMQECRQTMGVRAPVAIMETEAVWVPAMFGFLRPRLLLPNSFGNRFSPEELRLIFLHELAHYKRGDLVMNWLLILLNLLHWFNPVIWIAFARLRSDRELACDELVLNLSREEQTQQYGHVIIKLMEQFAERARRPDLVGVLEDTNQMQRRIRMIARWLWTLLGLSQPKGGKPRVSWAFRVEPAAPGLRFQAGDGSISPRFVLITRGLMKTNCLPTVARTA